MDVNLVSSKNDVAHYGLNKKNVWKQMFVEGMVARILHQSFDTC
jgi:hypothetical protein